MSLLNENVYLPIPVRLILSEFAPEIWFLLDNADFSLNVEGMAVDWEIASTLCENLKG